MTELNGIVEPDLKQRTVTGVMWSAGVRVAQQILLFAVTVILARLLLPEDFGLIAMIAVFTGFAILFVDFGLAAAIVQRKTITEGHRSSAFWMNLAAGVTIAGLVAALAPALAILFGEPRLVELTLVLSFNFVVGSLGIVQSGLLQRSMNFRLIGAIEITSTVVGGAAAIGAATAGLGVWSLIILTLASTAVRVVLLWLLSDWYPKFVIDRQAVRELWSFSGNLAGFSAVNYWSRNADNFLIGKFVGAEGLGIYSRAYNLMLMPLRQVSAVTARVMFPAFSRIQEDRPRVKRAYLRAIGIIGLLSFPVTAGLFVVAEPFVLTLYGAKWTDVVPVLQILCIAGLVQPVGSTVAWIYQSQGRTDWLFRWGLATSAITVAAFGIGILWGVHGIAVAFAIRTFLLLYFNFSIPGKLIDLSFSEVVAAVRGVLIAALLMAGIVWLVGLGLPDNWPIGSVLVIEVATGIAAYGLLVHVLFLRPYAELRELLREQWGRTVSLPA